MTKTKTRRNGWELLAHYKQLDTKQANDWLNGSSSNRTYSKELRQAIYLEWQSRQ